MEYYVISLANITIGHCELLYQNAYNLEFHYDVDWPYVVVWKG